MNQHLQVEKKETILLESFSLVYHEVMNLGCFHFVFLLTKVSKTFSPQAYHHVLGISYIQKTQSGLKFLFGGDYSFYFMY